MKRLALIGGLTRAVTDAYWNTIKAELAKQRNATPPGQVVVHALHTTELVARFQAGDWPGLTETLVKEGRAAIRGGAEAIVICGSALNPVRDEVRQTLNLPVIDITYEVGQRLSRFRGGKVGFLGVRSEREYMMWRDSSPGVDLVTPNADEQGWLTARLDGAPAKQGLEEDWRVGAQQILSRLRRDGAAAVVLADPVLARWVQPDGLVLVDAVAVHAWTAAVWALHADKIPGQSA